MPPCEGYAAGPGTFWILANRADCALLRSLNKIVQGRAMGCPRPLPVGRGERETHDSTKQTPNSMVAVPGRPPGGFSVFRWIVRMWLARHARPVSERNYFNMKSE